MGEKWAKPPRHRRRLRQLVYVLGTVLVLYCILFVFRTPQANSRHSKLARLGQRWSTDLLRSISLTQEQCEVAFPELTWSIDDVVSQGPFRLSPGNSLGSLVGRIQNGKIYVLSAQRKVDLSQEMLNSRTSALHQLHRATITSPEPMPNTIFAINFQDQPFGTAWSYSRAADLESRPKKDDDRTFLMPHFSFWTWQLPFVGSLERGAAAINAIEDSYSFAEKIPKAIWRGTTWFNSIHNPRLRANLLAAAKGKDWADVQALEWKGKNNASNALAIEDFCRYKYILHTEGVTYSGRFQFLQMCSSVVITPPIGWMQHTTHLVRPLFSSSLDFPHQSSHAKPKPVGGSTDTARQRWTPSERLQKTWPIQYRPEEANLVFVAPDWSDLEETIMWLDAHPKVAEGIALRQRELFVGGGYFSPAAEACYWRALVRGWNKVVQIDPEEWKDLDGVPYELFSLKNGD